MLDCNAVPLLLVLDNLPFDAQVANSIHVAGSSERIARRDNTLVSWLEKQLPIRCRSNAGDRDREQILKNAQH